MEIGERIGMHIMWAREINGELYRFERTEHPNCVEYEVQKRMELITDSGKFWFWETTHRKIRFDK